MDKKGLSDPQTCLTKLSIQRTLCNNQEANWALFLSIHGANLIMRERYYEEDRLIENIIAPFPLHLRKRTPLSIARPDIAAQWYHTKNDGYGPEDFSYGSNLKAWWLCAKNKAHAWQATIKSRTSKQGANCPHCYFESYGLDLRKYPNVLKFFHKQKNQDIDPFKIPIGANIWWHCKKGIKHEWCTRFNIDVVDAFCPFCRGRKAAPDNNITNFKTLSKEFHPTKNGKLKAKDLVPGSKRNIWWKCAQGDDHVFQMRPSERTIKGYNCPFCSHRRFSKSHSLLAEFPEIAKEWHKAKNGELKPSIVSSKAKQSVWWKCRQAKDHEWEATIHNRTYKGNGCPYCTNRALSATNNLATLFPDIAQQFDLKKNAPMRPDQIIAGTVDEYWWKCTRDHSWKRPVYLRTKRDSRCPECPEYGLPRIITSLKKAFPKIAKHWHPTKNGDKTPENTSFGSKYVAWWLCDKDPDHQWESWVGHITRNGYKCPFCQGSRLSATNSLQALHPALAREWHQKLNEQKASETKPGSAYKPWWRCSNCHHEWQRECYLRTRRKSACPQCKSYPR